MNTLLRLPLAIALVVGMLFLALVLYQQWQAAPGDETYWLTDPALDRLAAHPPRELADIASRVTQFTHIDAVPQIAKRAGYECAPADWKGGWIFCTVANEPTLKPGARVLLVHWDAPRRLRSVELRRMVKDLEPPYSGPQIVSASEQIAAGRGIEFASADVLADVIAERYGGFYPGNCLLDVNPYLYGGCVDERAKRSKQGLPKWDGKPMRAGKFEDAVGVLTGLGFQCAPLKPVDDRSAAARCETSSFSGQLQMATVEIDTPTSLPRAVDVELAGKRVRIPLVGRPQHDRPDTASVMVQTVDGKTWTLAIEPRMTGGSNDFGLEKYASLDAPSRRRVIDAAITQLPVLLTPQEGPLSEPLLQRLDIAAYMLSLLGPDGVSAAAKQVPAPPVDVRAAIALAGCRVEGEPDVCLAKFVPVETELRSRLTAALDEAKQATPPLAADHPVQMRLERLTRQLDSTQR